MSIQILTLALSSATLSGGARLVSAGGGLPQRITTEAPTLLSGVLGMDGYTGFWWASDNMSIWTGASTAGRYTRYLLDGSIAAQTPSVGGTIGAPSRVGISLYGCTATAIYEFDDRSGNQIRVVVVPSGTVDMVVKPWGTSTIWARSPLTGYFSELTWPVGAWTGRTISALAVSAFANAANFYTAEGTRLARYRLSDLALTAQWLFGPGWATSRLGDFNFLGHAGIWVDAQGRPHMWERIGGNVLRWNATGGTYLNAIEARLAWGEPELGGTSANSAVQAWFPPPCGYSDDGAYWGYVTARPAVNAPVDSIRVQRASIERARWSWTAPGAVTLRHVAIPGHLGRSWDGVSNFRRTRLYYSLNGGVDRTEIVPSAPLALALTTGQVLTLDVEMQIVGMPPGPGPYIGGDNGEGISLIYDFPDLNVFVGQPTARFAARSTGTLSLKGRLA